MSRMLLMTLAISMLLLLAGTGFTQPSDKVRYDHVGIFDEAIGGRDLKMHSNTGKSFPVFRIRDSAEISRNGKKCVVGDLVKGDRLRITIEEDNGGKKKEVIRIMATTP
jgi:hypothetical protein